MTKHSFQVTGPIHTIVMVSTLTVAGLALPACQSTAREFTASDEASIRTASKAYVQAEVSGDFDRWFAFSTADAVYMPSNSPSLQGRDALASWFRGLPQGGTFEATPQEIIGRSDLALERGSYAATVPGTSGTPPIRATGNYFAVWQRQGDGTWRILRAIWNTDQT